MGLGQARLLTITSRKADCEYRSMLLSHQKLSLSRGMTDISNEYQNSLNQTKLIYDYYGTGDQSNPLTYGLLMTPSALNDYMPTLITDPSGRTVLDSKMAAAARAAGIPQEGIGGLPSDIMRNSFVTALAGQGVITGAQRDGILDVPYNQTIGVGSTDIMSGMTVNTTVGNIDALIEALKFNTESISVDGLLNSVNSTYATESGTHGGAKIYGSSEELEETQLSLADLLTNDSIKIVLSSQDHKYYDGGWKEACSSMVESFSNSGIVEWLASQFGTVLDTGDAGIKAALAYATSQTSLLLSSAAVQEESSHKTDSKVEKECKNRTNDYLGIYVRENDSGGKDYNDYAGLNISNLSNAFLTYFANFCNGIANDSPYSADKGKTNLNNYVTNDSTYLYTLLSGVSFSTESAKLSGFYDALFNQLCTRGWTENNNVTDKEYLQNMFQNGMMFITDIKDDGYYYQGNYATNTYIKEVTDATAIAKAEAKYNTEKQKISHKEQILDLQMKNLDTEISALTTEYDTVKTALTKNLERTIKRYQA